MQRFKRTIRLLMIRMLIAILLLTGCHRSVEHKPEVAVILKSMGSDYFRNMISGINTAANEFNLSVSISGPAKEESWESQNLLIKAAINRKVSAIVLSAVSYTETSEAIREAVRADIPVIVVDSDVDSHQVALRISTDNYEAGRSMGEYVLSRGGKRVALLNHDRQSENGQARERGVRAVLSERPEVTVYPTLNVDSDIISSKSGALKLLRDYPEADTLITFNEWTTLGMGYAMEELGSTDRVTAVGFDSNSTSLDMLERGYMDALIVQSPFSMGYLSVEAASHLIRRERLPYSDKLEIGTMVITKDNLYEPASQKWVFPID